MILEEGREIAGNLRLQRLIGRGAMGSVWLAHHLKLNCSVAVKFLAATLTDDEMMVARFHQEARASATIRSPHVVQVFDHGTSVDHRPYIVMEYLEGESLKERIKRAGPLPLPLARLLVAHVGKGLAAAHRSGVVHRDIKPANIFLLDVEGEIFFKVLDFGVAKLFGEDAVEMTQAGHLVGTPAFMSPEQLFYSQEADHRSDLWAFAVVAYTALAGSRPFKGKSLAELSDSIRNRRYAPLSTIRDDLGADVDGWFDRALMANPDDRWQEATKMARAFDNLVRGENALLVSGPTATGAGRSYSGSFSSRPGTLHGASVAAAMDTPQRSRWRMWLAAAVTVLTIGGLAAYVTTSGPPAQALPPAENGPANAGEPALDERAPEPDETSRPDRAGPADSADPVASADTVNSAEAAGDVSAKPKAKARPVRPRPRPRPAPTPSAPAPEPGPDTRIERAKEELGL